MTSQFMNHEEAIARLAAERYLLGEMEEQERASFEEHYLNCVQCLEDVTFGDEFMKAAAPVAQELAQLERSGQARERASRGFFGWLRAGLKSPAPAWALAVALGVVATYQGLHREKGVYPESRLVLTGMAHGASEVKLIRARQGSILSLGVEYAPSGEFLSYRAEILSQSGEIKSTVAIPGDDTGNMAWIALLAKTLDAGRYSVVIKGKTVDGAEKEVGRGTFELQFEN
jgi:hypothetical protein